MAEPLAGGELLDPHGGRADLEARRLRMVSADALASDPLRTLRAIRIAVLLELTIEPATAAADRRAARRGWRASPPSACSASSSRWSARPAVRQGLALMEAHGITAQVLPELLALRGVEQNVFHHLDVHDHTLEVLDQVVAIERDPVAAGFGEHAGAVAALLAEPLADDLTRGRGDALRRAAARRREAADDDPAPRRPRDRLPRPRPRGGGARAGRPAPPAGLGEARRPRGRAVPAPPAARLPRPRARRSAGARSGATCARRSRAARR